MGCHSLRIVIFISTFLMGVGTGATDAGIAPAETFDAGNLEVSIDNADNEGALDSGNPDVGNIGDGGISGDPVAIDATVIILTPAEGETVEGPWIEVSFQVQGCQINGPSQDPTGCHLHKILDGAIYQDPEGGGTGHYNPTPLQMYVGTPGSHLLKLILVRNDGTDLPYEPEVGDSVTVNVAIEATASEEDDEDSEEDVPYTAPIREKSPDGCNCESSNSDAATSMVLGLLLLGILGRHRRRF